MLEFDEQAPYLVAVPVFDEQAMRALVVCTEGRLGKASGEWLDETREEPDLIWEPLVIPFGEIDEAPDHCGFRLVRRVYQAFGWRESAMPRQFDRETGRLILPE